MRDDRSPGAPVPVQPSLGLGGGNQNGADEEREDGVPPGTQELPPVASYPPAPAPLSDAFIADPGVRAAPPAPAESSDPGDPPANASSARSMDARLARLHLRGGLIALARAELEQMAGAGILDREALVDLAETRWRSGDLDGAAEAAEAHLDAGGTEPLAEVIVAEALDRKGHMIDARGHSARVTERLGPGAERLFAGEPRSSAWPGAASIQLYADARAVGRWGLLVGGREVADPDRDEWQSIAAPEPAERGASGVSQAGTPAAAARAATGGVPVAGSIAALVDAGRAAGLELEAVESQVAAGDMAGVPERLALLLRMDRALAPVILSIADRVVASMEPGESGMSTLQLVRGDAYRSLGRDVEATAAYRTAMRAIPAPPTAKESM